jgi:CRISPR-associated endonuclease/helicase Cas3
LEARKELRFNYVPVARKTLPTELAKLAWQRYRESPEDRRIVIYCDRRADASATRTEIARLAGKAPYNVELLVGERRVHERQRVETWLEEQGFVAGTDRTDIAGPAFLIATAAGEVGVDLDADHMICDLVTWERMVQRLGRVNRRGTGAAVIDVLIVAPDKPDAPTDHDRRAARCANVLSRLPALSASGRNASPAALSELAAQGRSDAELAALLQQATTPVPLRPKLTRALVEAWSLTSLRDHPGRPEVGPWLRGWVEQEPQTSIIWRQFLPWRAGETAPRSAEVNAFFAHAGQQRIETLGDAQE